MSAADQDASGAETLFEGWEPEERKLRPSEDPTLSPGRRLTLRQAEMIEDGIHPLTRGALHPLASQRRDADAPRDEPFTCGSCLFRKSEKYHNGTYAKCWLPNPKVGADAPQSRIYDRVTHGAASDVRAWWPACPDYSAGDSAWPDAARWINAD